jgi:N-acetyltransferase 10
VTDLGRYVDFRKRFISLLSFKFREFGSVTALSLLEATNSGVKKLDEDGSKGWLFSSPGGLTSLMLILVELMSTELSILLTPFDLKRLESYANNMLDYHVILDLLPTVASVYFQKRLGDNVKLSAVQSAILLALGLQRKTVEEVEVIYDPELFGFHILIRKSYRQSFNSLCHKPLLFLSRSFGKSPSGWWISRKRPSARNYPTLLPPELGLMVLPL